MGVVEEAVMLWPRVGGSVPMVGLTILRVAFCAGTGEGSVEM